MTSTVLLGWVLAAIVRSLLWNPCLPELSKLTSIAAFFPWPDRFLRIITGCATAGGAHFGNDQVGISGILKFERIGHFFTLDDFAKIMFNLGEIHDRKVRIDQLFPLAEFGMLTTLAGTCVLLWEQDINAARPNRTNNLNVFISKKFKVNIYFRRLKWTL